METRVGTVTHYYDRLGVAVLSLESGLCVGDTIHICGYSTDIIQRVNSLEIDHQKVQTVGPEADVALKVDDRVHRGDIIYRVPEPTGIRAFGVE